MTSMLRATRRYSPHPVGPTIIVSLLALIFSITRRLMEEGKAGSFVILQQSNQMMGGDGRTGAVMKTIPWGDREGGGSHGWPPGGGAVVGTQS